MKITVHVYAEDTDNGTNAYAYATEREAEDNLLEAIGQDRAALDAWLADNPDGCIWDFKDECGEHDHLDTFNVNEFAVDIPLCAQPIPATGKDQVAEAIECLQRARDLLKAADNRRTLERVRLALSSAKGAARIQSGRATRARLAAEAAAANPYRRSNLFVSGIRGLGHGADFEKVADENADAFAVLRRDQCPDGFDLLSVSVDFFDSREEAETYLDAIAVEG